MIPRMRQVCYPRRAPLSFVKHPEPVEGRSPEATHVPASGSPSMYNNHPDSPCTVRPACSRQGPKSDPARC